MTVTVGTKGQIVINKEILDRLGIKPRWMALQRIVGGHVEIYFLPPEHNKSLLGCLEKQAKVRLKTDKDLNKARGKAWETAEEEKFGHGSGQQHCIHARRAFPWGWIGSKTAIADGTV